MLVELSLKDRLRAARRILFSSGDDAMVCSFCGKGILLFWFYGLRGLSLIYLSFSGFSTIELSVFAIFYGLDWVATVPPTVKLAAENFGREKASLVFGWVFAGHQFGAATAAFGAGWFNSDYDTYMPALMFWLKARGHAGLYRRQGRLRITIASATLRQER